MTNNVGSILILSEQPVLAALVGVLVELTGSQPVFAETNEQPADALQRLRPLAVILVDCELGTAHSDLFFALAARKRVGVAVFGSDAQARRIGEIAAARAIPWFTLPPGPDRIRAAIEAAMTSNTSHQERGAERRHLADATPVAADGTRILRDTVGRHWMVYDRRGLGERRSAKDAIADRVFIAEDGETRHCMISELEQRDESLTALERQLERATT